MSHNDRNARPSLLPGIVSALALVLLLTVAIYIAGYFWMAERSGAAYDPVTLRETFVIKVFPQGWLADIYQPLAPIDGACTGRRVVIMRRVEANAVD